MIRMAARHGRLMSKLTILLVIAAISFLAGCGNNKSFDSVAWLTADTRSRGRMCEDLIDRRLLIGQPVSEAKRLLGEPDKTYASVLSYNIDMGWPFKDPKSYGLQVHLDQNSNVREVKIVD